MQGGDFADWLIGFDCQSANTWTPHKNKFLPFKNERPPNLSAWRPSQPRGLSPRASHPGRISVVTALDQYPMYSILRNIIFDFPLQYLGFYSYNIYIRCITVAAEVRCDNVCRRIWVLG